MAQCGVKSTVNGMEAYAYDEGSQVCKLGMPSDDWQQGQTAGEGFIAVYKISEL